MNERLQQLREKATELIQSGYWDELISVLTEIISLEEDPYNKTVAYNNRGIAYYRKGEYDRAIADFNGAISLTHDYANAYNNRGNAYSRKGEYDRAIADFDEALKLSPDDANVYYSRGDAYSRKGEYDRAIADFDEALKLSPDDADAYYSRGVAYYGKDEYDRAIADFDEALKLRSDDADIYYSRGIAYCRKGVYDLAVADFVKAEEHDKALKFQYPIIYIALQINAIHGTDEDNRKQSFKLYFRLLAIINAIQAKLFYKTQEVGTEVAHYTSFHTLKSMMDGGRFRLYNAAYMNDLEEGRVFFEMIKKYAGMEKIEDRFYGGSENRSPAYIGSFMRISEDDDKDKLPLWSEYGKHDGEKAAGSCLIFKRACFAEEHQLQIWGRERLKSDQQVDVSENQGVRQDAKLPIYKICYKDTENERKLSGELRDLASTVSAINKFIADIKGDEQKNKLRELTRELLDSIRFLFKARYYNEEREVRLIDIPYHREDGAQESERIQVDLKHNPPRFYTEALESCRFSEVILGPRARDIDKWAIWIKERDKGMNVTKSTF